MDISEPPQAPAPAAAPTTATRLVMYGNITGANSPYEMLRTQLLKLLRCMCRWHPLCTGYYGLANLNERAAEGNSPFSTRRHTAPWDTKSGWKALSDMPASPQPLINMAIAWNRAANEHHQLTIAWNRVAKQHNQLTTAENGPKWESPPAIVPLNEIEY